MSEHLLYEIAVSLLPDVGPINGKKLVAYCGGAKAIFEESRAALLKIPGIGNSLVNNIINHSVFSRAEEEIDFIEKNGINAYFFLHEHYPNRLTQCADSPLMIYYKGNLDLNHSKIVSIVGTRRSTPYGKQMCEQIIKDLSDHDVLVISGLAYGIDTYAHRFAIKYNLPTVGVVAHGLENLYPSQNKELAEKMKENGGILTEFNSFTKMEPHYFPRRNRIIAGLSDATVVVEAARKGGALITADIANSYNRDVFAVPGRTNDKYSEGCNLFIRNNRASLVQSGKDILYIMNWMKEQQKPKIQRQLFVELTDEEKVVYKCINRDQDSSIDDIMIKSAQPMSKVSALLLQLEFKGAVMSLPGKIYRRL